MHVHIKLNKFCTTCGIIYIYVYCLTVHCCNTCSATSCLRTLCPFVAYCHSVVHNCRLNFHQVLTFVEITAKKCPISSCEALHRPTTDVAISWRPMLCLHVLSSACQWRKVWHTVPYVWPACIEAQSQQTLCQCYLASCTKYHSQDCCESQECLFLCLYGMQKQNMTQLNKGDSLMQMQAGVSDLAV